MAVRLSKVRAVVPVGTVRTCLVFGSELEHAAKHGPVVRGHRFHLGNSYVLEWSDVIERADGTVWLHAMRRPGRATFDGQRVMWERLRQPFELAVIGKRDFERDYVTGEEPIQFWYGARLPVVA